MTTADIQNDRESHYYLAGMAVAMAATSYTSLGCLQLTFDKCAPGPVSRRWQALDALQSDTTIALDMRAFERARQVWGLVAVELYKSGGNAIEIESLLERVSNARNRIPADWLVSDWWWSAAEAQTILLNNWSVVLAWVEMQASGVTPEVWGQMRVGFRIPFDHPELPEGVRQFLQEQYGII